MPSIRGSLLAVAKRDLTSLYTMHDDTYLTIKSIFSRQIIKRHVHCTITIHVPMVMLRHDINIFYLHAFIHVRQTTAKTMTMAL